MELVDAIPRFSAVGLLLLAAAVFFRDMAGTWAGRFIGAFALASVGYLFCSHAETRVALGPLLPGLLVICVAAPAFLWLSALAIFDDGFSPRPRHWAALVAIELTGLAAALAPNMREAFSFLHAALTVGLFSHAVVIAWRDLGSDLIEGRRELRRVFIGAVSLFGLVVVAVEVGHIGRAVPVRLETAAAWAVFVIAFGLLLAALRIDPARFFVPVAGDAAPPPHRQGLDALAPADQVLLQRVIAAMEEERLYRRNGLTIAALARTLNVPEHHLRRAINQGLGYRNFSAFLNRYRLDDVARSLADPAKARMPVLTLAMDAGYGSLAPFNRAFRAQFGTTPSAYRSLKLGEAFVADGNGADRSSKTLIDSKET